MSKEEKNYFNKRLNTIEGQIKGINKMIEEDRKSIDILIQISAVSKSLKSVSQRIIKDKLNESKSLKAEEIIKLFNTLG